MPAGVFAGNEQVLPDNQPARAADKDGGQFDKSVRHKQRPKRKRGAAADRGTVRVNRERADGQSVHEQSVQRAQPGGYAEAERFHGDENIITHDERADDRIVPCLRAVVKLQAGREEPGDVVRVHGDEYRRERRADRER